MKKITLPLLLTVLGIFGLHLYAQSAPTPVSTPASIVTVMNNAGTVIAAQNAQIASQATTIGNNNAQWTAAYAAANKLNLLLPTANQVNGP